jgi:polyphenol oxidase
LATYEHEEQNGHKLKTCFYPRSFCSYVFIRGKNSFLFYLDSLHIYRVSELDVLPWLVHGFGTRHSDVPGMFSRLASLKQIHSSECVAASGRSGVLGEGDALLENVEGGVVSVKTADCVPILLVDDIHRAVAAVHAGWRGTVAGIVGKAVVAMRERFGSESRELFAAIGPSIGKCCYEVGPEVSAQFGLSGRAFLDLPEFNRRQLMDSGVTGERIFASNLCTQCRADEFHSFRRDREAAGRLYSFAGIRPQAQR